MQSKKYFIGLDMGTSYIGWAAVNNDYELIKKSGKHLWGVRQFESAESAKARRLFRRNRKSINKRNWRLHLLKQELKSYILNEDSNFYKKITESQIIHADKKGSFLFNEKNYKDATYHREFPTIYHLRYSLMDIEKVKKYQRDNRYYRFLFLAIHDILKTRGHFLSTSSLESKGKVSITDILEEIRSFIADYQEENSEYVPFDETFIIEGVSNFVNYRTKNLTKKDKNTQFIKLLIGGYEVDINKVFDVDGESTKISFDQEQWEDKVESQSEISKYLEKLFSIYSMIKLYIMMGEFETYSESKVNVYQKHKRQLLSLKQDIKRIDEILQTKHYAYLFASQQPKENSSYTNYVRKEIIDGRKHKPEKSDKSYQDFINKLCKIKEDYQNITGDMNCLVEINDDGYLEIPTTSSNRLIPHQLHLMELKKMLSVFREVSDVEKVVIDNQISHIVKLLTFKVPYFVGSLSKHANFNKEKNYWIVKKSNAKINPYNYEEIIDLKGTNKEFIKRMLRKCTYLENEFCIQQETILYQDYIFYNTINKVKINDAYLSKTQKSDIYQQLLNGKHITKKYLISILNLPEDTEILGFSKDSERALDISLSAKKKYNKIFPTHKNNKYYEAFFDHVINEISFIDKDADELKIECINNLLDQYQKIELTKDQVLSLSKITSKKWGNLSDKLLKGIYFVNPKDGTGELKSMLEWLSDSNYNLMEILYDDLGFNIGLIEKENSGDNKINSSKELHDYLEKRYIAPQVRRSIIQAIRIIDEIIQIMGCEPEQISIEFTRDSERNPKETNSRYEQLNKLYTAYKAELPYADLTHFEKEQSKLKSKKLYLYFIQGGMDLYTGKKIDFDMLQSDNRMYDIDHIFPQSKIKDDSLDNLVLTSSIINGDKGNVYPLPLEIREKNYQLWKQLKERELISSKKFERLTRKHELTEDELLDFVNRQKNTLDWMNIEIANLLALKYKKDKNNFIIYSKSRHVSDFRKNIECYKFRELNHFHHAHDAFLNVIVGRIVKNHNFYITNEGFKSNNVERIIINKLKHKIDYVKRVLQFNDPLVTKKTTVKNTGSFWDQNLVSKKDNLVPMKKHLDPKRYGGYNKPSTAFFCIVETHKGLFKIKPVLTYECSHFYDAAKFNVDKFKSYILSKNNDVKSIIVHMIPIHQKIIIDGIALRISGRDKESISYHQTVELNLSSKAKEILRKIINKHEFIKNKLRKDLDEYYGDDCFNDDNINFVFGEVLDKVELLKFPKLTKGYFKREYVKEKFEGLSKSRKSAQLKEILTNILQANNSNTGKLLDITCKSVRKSGNIKYNLSLVKESITGFYSKREDIYIV